jgi:hypothetical protein
MLNRAWEFNELFYWAPDHPKIVIKQGHVIKNFLKLHAATSEFMVKNKELGGPVTTTIDGKLSYLTLTGLHKLIYPSWVPVPYQEKPKSLVFTARDTWFFNLSDSDPAKYAWKTGLEHRWRATPDFLKQDNLARGFQLFGIPYYIGT